MSNGEDRKNGAARKNAPVKRRKKKKSHPILRFIGGLFGTLFTFLLIGCLTGLMLVGIFMTYINTTLAPDLQVDASEYTLELSSIIYYQDKETGEWVELQKLHGTENRVLVDYEDIPKYLIDATISIEDERFETHAGVDWKRTAGATFKLLTGNKSYGGSTITQQLLKNMTGDRESTIKRKVTEIFRALVFEQNYSKEEILEMYLNTITLGQGCYGVQTAAQLYFNKDVSELTLAECACIISITNNPSLYGPFSTVKLTNPETGVVKTARELNKARQELVLGKMLELERITQEEYDQAMAEELQFADSSRTVEDVQAEQADANKDKEESKGKQSWFVDQLRREVVSDMVEQLGITSKQAEEKILYGGYNIYTTLDLEIQEMAESVYEDRSNLDVVSKSGQQMRSGITIVDITNGNVVAMVGDVGAKQGDMILNYATVTRQCGSSIKPLAVYAPAIDAGAVTMATVFDDYPVELLKGTPWPKNSPTKYTGRTMLDRGIYNSINTYALQTLLKLGLKNSYQFATENLGLTTLTEEDAAQAGNLGLGGLHYGVNTLEMAAAFASFANEGIYNSPRMYVKVTDSEGKTVIDNEGETVVAMKESTAYLMNTLLKKAVTNGTGYSARLTNMTVAGKTGTTNDNFDRYFVGYTPYYSAAVWTGYNDPEKIVYSGNPAITMWKLVMEKIHAELEKKDFSKPESGLLEVEVCKDSGLLVGTNCRQDVRGSRVTKVTVASGTAPTETCSMHVLVDYCTEGKCIAGHGCPAESIKTVAVLDYERPEFYTNAVYDEETDTISPPTTTNELGEIVELPYEIVPASDDAYVMSRLDDILECPTHGLGEGWSYDENGNLIYTPPYEDPTGGLGGLLPGDWGTGEGDTSGWEDWWNSLFGGGTTDPGVTDPNVTDPNVTDPNVTEPGTPDPGVTEPAENGTGDLFNWFN